MALFSSPMVFAAIALVVLVSILNFAGIKQSSRVNIVFTAVEIGGLLLVIVLGFGNFGGVNYFEFPSISGVFAVLLGHSISLQVCRVAFFLFNI